MFEKDLFARNIQYLAAKQGKKIGELEKAAEVSPGYISRMLKENGKNSAPIVELMLAASKEFGVSVDDLLLRRMDAVHPSEMYLKAFFGKLKDDTLAGKISWTIETRETLLYRAGKFPHPRIEYVGAAFPGEPEYGYSSPFGTKHPLGDCSARTCLGGKLLYIVQVEAEYDTGEKTEGLEVYFASSVEDQSVENIACVWSGDSLFETVSDMLVLAEETNSRINLSPSVRTTIDRYMGKSGKAELASSTMYSDVDLPF